MGFVQKVREYHAKTEVEEALRSKIKEEAPKECDNLALKYVECASGKTTNLSLIRECHKQAKEYEECLRHFTSHSVLKEMMKECMLKHEVLREKALKECDNLALKYEECASGRNISHIWQCRKKYLEYLECHRQITSSVVEEMTKEYKLKQEGKASR